MIHSTPAVRADAGKLESWRREGTASLAVRLGVASAVRAATPHYLRVLAYHEVDDASAFESQVRYLRDHYRVVSLADLLSAADGGPTLPDRSVLITFDDGDRSVLETALPILRRHGAPAVCFVIAGLVGETTPPWWEEVRALCRLGAWLEGASRTDWLAQVRALKLRPNRERLAVLDLLRERAGHPAVLAANLRPDELLLLEAAGISIGNHTWSHPCLDRCDEDEVAAELKRAHERLVGILGHPVESFAFPNGNVDVRAEPVLARLGYRMAFAFDHRLQKLPIRDRLRVSRIRVSASTPLARFRVIVDGAHPLAHQALGRR